MLLFFLMTVATAQDGETCIEFDELERCFKTYPIGASMNPRNESQRFPLVIELHGYGSSYAVLPFYTGFTNLAVQQFVLVTPQGTRNLEGFSDSSSSWNAGGCCGASSEEFADIDDVGFLTEVVKQTIETYDYIDVSRIYFVGHSNGCAMALRMGAQTDFVAAVGCHALYLVSNFSADYVPIPRITVHGEADETVSFTDFFGFNANDNARDWAKENSCNDSPNITTGNGGLSRTIHYLNCTNSADTVLVALPNVGHQPYKGRDTQIDTTRIVWDFMEKYTRDVSGSAVVSGSPSSSLSAVSVLLVLAMLF